MELELDQRIADANIQEGPRPLSPGLFTIVLINELAAAHCCAELQKRYFKKYLTLFALGTTQGETGPTKLMVLTPDQDGYQHNVVTSGLQDQKDIDRRLFGQSSLSTAALVNRRAETDNGSQ